MMLRKLTYVVLLILLTIPVYAVDTQALMASGNRAYEGGVFDEAIMEYEKILAADRTSVELHYNLGCAYFNKEIYGQAVLHFEKARILSPRDPDILHNLEYTKLFLKDRFDLPDPMPLVAWFSALRNSLALAELTRLEMIFFGLLVMSIVAYRLFRGRSYERLLVLIMITTSLLFCIGAGWLLDRAIALDQKHAVLLVEQSNVNSAPIGGSSTLFVIHEGTTGEILDTTDTWYKIRLPDGKTGWVRHEVVGLY